MDPVCVVAPDPVAPDHRSVAAVAYVDAVLDDTVRGFVVRNQEIVAKPSEYSPFGVGVGSIVPDRHIRAQHRANACPCPTIDPKPCDHDVIGAFDVDAVGRHRVVGSNLNLLTRESHQVDRLGQGARGCQVSALVRTRSHKHRVARSDRVDRMLQGRPG